jgi:hypothetical protein
MKNLKILIFIYVVTIFSFYHYHNDKVESLNSEIENLTTEKELTQEKLNIIENAMKDMVKSKTNGTLGVIKTKKTDTNNSVLNDEKSEVNTKDILKVIIKTEKNDDPNQMIKFPNREGQDLVNSLKLKTEL